MLDDSREYSSPGVAGNSEQQQPEVVAQGAAVQTLARRKTGFFSRPRQRRTLLILGLAAGIAVGAASWLRLSNRSPSGSARAATGGDPRLIQAQQAFDSEDFELAANEYQSIAEAGNCSAAQLALIDERLRVCQAGMVAGARPRFISMAANLRQPHPLPKAGEIVQLDIKSLGNFEYDENRTESIPADVRSLSGHEIQLHGFISAFDQSGAITHFTLVPSLSFCCFGQPPQIQHTVEVECSKGDAIQYASNEVAVKGLLTVAENKSDGFVVSLFKVAAEQVEPFKQ